VTALRWLDLLDPLVRRLLLGLTVGSLVVGTLLLEQLDQPVLVLDGIALGWLGGLGILWAGVRWRAQPRVHAQRLRESARREADLHDRGLLVGGAVIDRHGGLRRLSDEDPHLSLPALMEWGWLLFQAAKHDEGPLPWLDVQTPEPSGFDQLAELDVLGVNRTRRGVKVGLAVTTVSSAGDRATVCLSLERPPGVMSPPAELLSHLERPDRADDWHLMEVRPIDPPPVPTKPSPTLASDRRALQARHEDFDAEAFEARVHTMVEELASGQHDRLASRCAPLGQLALAAPRALTDAPLTWLDIDTDGDLDRIEVACRGVVLGLCRSSSSDGDWLLWRLRGGRP